MSSGGRGYSYGSYDSGAHEPRSNGYRTGSHSQDSSHGNRNPALVPAYAETTSRRRIMNIEDVLNPSDEGTRRYQQPQSSGSYEPARTVSENSRSLQGNRPPTSGPQSHGASASASSRGGHRAPQGQRGRGIGAPDIPSQTRSFRPPYTSEEEHFIWYLRLDVSIISTQKLLSRPYA